MLGCLGLAALAALLLQRDGAGGRDELQAAAAVSTWGAGAPGWWSSFPVYTGATYGLAAPGSPGAVPVGVSAALPAAGASVSAAAAPEIKINGIPVEGAGDAEVKVNGIPVEGLQRAAPAVAAAPVVAVHSTYVPPSHHWGTRPHGDYVAPAVAAAPVVGVHSTYLPPSHQWGTRPHDDYPETTQGPYRPYPTVTHHWGTRKHEDYADAVFSSYAPYPMLAHHWGTRKHQDFTEDVFGRHYRPDPSIAHHWGTREHTDYTDDVFGRHYRPDPSVPHHWGTRSHGDYANDVFRQYRPDPSWASHYGTRSHHDYVSDVYGHAYQPDPVIPYHWGTRKHADYADDVFDRPFVSWDMPYGVAPPRAGGFAQDISPSENAAAVMRAGAENKSAEWGYGWTGVRETGPGGTFKSWWPPGNRQQDVKGEGGNAVPTVRGDAGPNNYRIPFHEYIAQYANVGNQGPPPIAKFSDMDKPLSWKAAPAKLALHHASAAKAAAQLRLRAKASLASQRQGAAAKSKLAPRIPGTHDAVAAQAERGARPAAVAKAPNANVPAAKGAPQQAADSAGKAGLASSWLHAQRSSSASAGAGHWVWEPSRRAAPGQRQAAAPTLQTALATVPWYASHPLMRAVAQRIAERSPRREEEGGWRQEAEQEARRQEEQQMDEYQQQEQNAAAQQQLGQGWQWRPDPRQPLRAVAQHQQALEEGRQRHAAADGKAGVVAWGYAGGTGPAHWGALSPAFASCSAGHQQSPINLEGVNSRVSGPLHMRSLFWETPPSVDVGLGGMLGNGGGTIYDPSDSDGGGQDGGDERAEAGPSSFTVLRQGGLQLVAHGMRPVLVFEQRRFALEKMYLHTPSEHTIDGVPADAELQLVVPAMCPALVSWIHSRTHAYGLHSWCLPCAALVSCIHTHTHTHTHIHTYTHTHTHAYTHTHTHIHTTHTAWIKQECLVPARHASLPLHPPSVPLPLHIPRGTHTQWAHVRAQRQRRCERWRDQLGRRQGAGGGLRP